MNNLQERGRALYKRGEYQKAIGVFDRAIGKSPSVQLLDNRAACHEKLGELSTALKDAKKAIQLHREDATGYLRAGKVLVKMDKEVVALEIYTHGLKCIKHVGQGYEVG
jgi:tetratricopeptide (TPR) repeat protein